MKKILTSNIFSIFILTSSQSKTIQITNPGNNKDIQPAINTALRTALDGDILCLPEGVFIFNKSIIVSKFISFKGAGIGKTILYRSPTVPDSLLSFDDQWNVMFCFNINKTMQSNISVTGITFRSKNPSITKGDGGSLASDIGIRFIKCVDFVVSHCRFEYFGNGAVSVVHSDTLARGLICKNEFYRNAKGFDGLGLGYGVVVYGDNNQWVSNPKFGSNNFIFIESNTFDYHRHAIAARGCGLYVARYNTITNNIISQDNSTHAIDAHEARGGKLGNGNYFSTRAIEVYNNTILNTTFYGGKPIVSGQKASMLIERAIAIRGGEAVVYGNTIKGYRFGGSVGIAVFPWGTNYPLPYSPGYISGSALGANHSGTNVSQGNGDAFFWGNKFTPYDNLPESNVFYNYDPSHFVLGRDYHVQAKPGYVPYTYPHPHTLIADCTTDINKDGITSNTDLLLLLSKFGQTCVSCTYDVNKDGSISNADLMLILSCFDQPCR
jgi:hypothetical protein